MNRITGAQARALLNDTHAAPWEESEERGVSPIIVAEGRTIGLVSFRDKNLIAAAPDLAETVAWLWSELERLRDFADEDFPPADYAQIASYDPEGAAQLREAEKTLRLVHRQYQRRIHSIFRAAPAASNE